MLPALAATRWAPVSVLAAMVLLCFVPGRLLLRLTGWGAGWDAAGRAVLSVAVSLVAVPVLLNPLWHVTREPYALLGALWCVCVALAVAGMMVRGDATWRVRLVDLTLTRWVAGVLGALVVVATIGPYWPTELRGYPVPSLIHDFVKHYAVLFWLEGHTLPLGNPFYAAGDGGAVYYYHFFYLIPATVRALASGVSIELAFGLASAAVALSVAAMVYLLTKRFTGSDGPATLAAMLATVAGGLDVVGVLVFRMPVITLDAWADHVVRIHSLLNQMMWSPQNAAGLLVVLVAAYGLSVKGLWWRGWFVAGPVLAGSVVGTSVWVAMPALIGLAVFVAVELIRSCRQPRSAMRRLLAAVAVAVLMLLCAWPSVAGYVEMAGRHGKGLTTTWPHQWHVLLGRYLPAGPLANLADLPWVLLLELGALVVLPLMVPRAIWRRAWTDPGRRWLMMSAVVAVVGYVTVRSHFQYNDFGQKSMLVAMAAGLLMAACVVSDRRVRPRWWNPLGWALWPSVSGRPRVVVGVVMAVVLIGGLPMGFYEVPLTAVRRYLPTDGTLGKAAHRNTRRIMAEGAAYAFLRHQLPPDAVVQAHWGSERVDLLQIARRPIGVTELQADTMVFTPADADAHAQCLADVQAALSGSASAAQCRAILNRYGITHVVVGEIEREQWGDVSKFAEAGSFEQLFDDTTTSIYAVR